MNDAAPSIPRNIAEGYGRNSTKQYYEFLGFAFASLLELLEDYFELELEIKGGERKTRDDDGALMEVSKAIKLLMGEKTMFGNQIEKIKKMMFEQGQASQNQKIARILAERPRKEKEFVAWLQKKLKEFKKLIASLK